MSTGTVAGRSTRARAGVWQAAGVGLLANTADNVLLLLVLWIAGFGAW